MARALDEQGQALLDAASGLLASEGASALTVRRIAADAGCSTMGVYSRFGNKDGVVDHLYMEGFRRLTDAIDGVGDSGNPLEDMHRCGLAYRRNALENATYYLVMFARAVPGFAPSDEARVVSQTSFHRLVERVRKCQEAGQYVEGSPAAMAEVIWGSMHGHVMLELVGMRATGDDPAERYERMLELIEQGFRHPGAAPRSSVR
ncbi:MAG TPA: TetR/AcrR family transcriptional regulator [Acidimicrobiales bacterium]|nr:TetR/AcrR family transcriptional regulator [Acidimicrobiales bacterium]